MIPSNNFQPAGKSNTAMGKKIIKILILSWFKSPMCLCVVTMSICD